MRRFRWKLPRTTTFGGFQKERQGLAPENSINTDWPSAARTLTTNEVFCAFGPSAAMRHRGRATKCRGTFWETESSSSGSSLLGWRHLLVGLRASPDVLWEMGREEHTPKTMLSVCPCLSPPASAGSLGLPLQGPYGAPKPGRT